MPVGELPHLRRSQGQTLAHSVQHDEIVAGALHLGERELHGFFFNLLS
jgi:hypothetical protein